MKSTAAAYSAKDSTVTIEAPGKALEENDVFSVYIGGVKKTYKANAVSETSDGLKVVVTAPILTEVYEKPLIFRSAVQ